MHIFILCLVFASASAPLLAQTIAGIVLDKTTESPLPGAVVDLPDLHYGAITDAQGFFSIKNLAPRRYSVRIRCLGYDEEVLPDVLVTNGKDSDLKIFLEEASQAVAGVVISGTNKAKPVNRLAKASAIALNPENIARFSGSRGNVARMAGSFAGVGATDDFQNNLVVRGNTPTGLLWRLEGVPIPNPGHLSTYGNSGGSFSALNPNLLGQSDFLTGAFPSEYGNTIAAVMDMAFRTGNKERYEFTAQVGAWSGVETLAEGPLWRKQNGSFVVGYRYSFVDLLKNLGARVGGNYVPQYQDLNWKFDAGKGKHRLSFFGLSGASHIFVQGKDVDPENPYHPTNADSELRSNLSINGVRYQLLIDSQSFWRTTVAYCYNRLKDEGWKVSPTGDRTLESTGSNREDGLRLSSLWQRRQTKRITLRAGIQMQSTRIDTRLLVQRQTSEFVPVRNYRGNLSLFEGFAQMQYKVKKRYSVNIGAHLQHLPLNGETRVEPRGTLKLKLPKDNDLILACGLYSQTLPLAALFFTTDDGTAPNHALNLLRSRQGVLAWAKKWDGGWRLRAEAYLQWQTKAPVHQQPDGYSLLNYGNDFYNWDFANLTSTGTGRNYGLEWTLTKTYQNGFYGLFTLSLFQSEYRGSDGVWRNTAFNNQYIGNILLGKEWPIRKNLRLTLDTKCNLSGGYWFTPLDLAKSIASGQEVFDETQPYSLQYPTFFRWDAKAGLRYDTRRITHHFFLDFTNLTNRRNVYGYRYFAGASGFSVQQQLGFTPDFVYRVQF